MSASSMSFFFLLLLFPFPFELVAARHFDSFLDWDKRVGGWTEIPDAGSNKSVRELGRYSVNEYNHGLRAATENPIAFSGVVSAARQVVSGIKYRMRISAVDDRTGDPRSFDAVVIVRPWIRCMDRRLISFSPSVALSA